MYYGKGEGGRESGTSTILLESMTGVVSRCFQQMNGPRNYQISRLSGKPQLLLYKCVYMVPYGQIGRNDNLM